MQIANLWRSSADNSGRKPELRFILFFSLLAGLFEFFLVAFVDQMAWYESYLSLNAHCSASLVRILGVEVDASERTLVVGNRVVKIVRNCDAIEPAAFFVIAVLLFPASRMRKTVGLVAGVLLIEALNVLRIASLLFSLQYYPVWFEQLHLRVWPAAMILFILAFWALWALWALGSRSSLDQSASLHR